MLPWLVYVVIIGVGNSDVNCVSDLAYTPRFLDQLSASGTHDAGLSAQIKVLHD